MYGDIDEKPLTPELLFVEGIESSSNSQNGNEEVKGFGVYGKDVMFCSSEESSIMSLIIAHELGHALFNIGHPKDASINNLPDGKSYMHYKPSLENGDKLSNKIMRLDQLRYIR